MRFFRLFFIFTVCLSLYSSIVLRYVRTEDVNTLDPALQWDFYSSEVLANIFEGLVTFKEGSREIKPLLAVKWEKFDNGRRWIFYLRKGVKFHDGSSFDADSVVYSLKRMLLKSEKARGPIYSFIKDVRKIDSYTVEILLASSYSPFLYLLSVPNAYIVAPTSERGGKFFPIGTGPFKFKKWTRGKKVVLEANENYWRGRPYINKLLFIPMDNSTWRLLQLKNGNADVIKVFSSKEYISLKNNPEIKILYHPSPDINYIVFNTSKPPFDDINLRKAIAHLIRRERMVELYFQKLALVANSLIPPGIFGSDIVMKEYEYNPGKVMRFLGRAGHPRGFSCTLYTISGRSDLKELLFAIIRRARKFGIRIKMISLPMDRFKKEVLAGHHDMVAAGWVTYVPDPDNILYPLFSGVSRNNYSLFKTRELDDLLEKARALPNNEERKKIYRRVLNIIHNRVLMIPLYHSTDMVAYRKEIEGLKFEPRGFLLFKDAKIPSLEETSN